MAITAFGKAIRKARIDADTNLASMANELGTTPSFLSAIEMGRKKIPKEWIEKIEKYFAQHGVSLALNELAAVANKNVSIDGLSHEQQMLVAGFARVNMDQVALDKFKTLLSAQKR